MDRSAIFTYGNNVELVSTATDIGTRDVNEDFVSYHHDRMISIFGIYDGHSGTGSATIVSRTIPERIVDDIKEYLGSCEIDTNKQIKCDTIKEIIDKDIWEMDYEICSNYKNTNDESGTTMCLCIIVYDIDILFTACIGDSSIFISSIENNNPFPTFGRVSQYHTPDMNASEIDRILKAGGTVHAGRIMHENHGLRLSRTLGDPVYKMTLNLRQNEQMIIPKADICAFSLMNINSIILLTDGITDALSDSEILTYVYNTVLMNKPRTLINSCKAKNIEYYDNMTCMYISLKEYSALCGIL